MLKIIKLLLLEIVDRIDAGNSNLTTQEEIEIINLLKLYSDKDVYMNKYEAFNYYM